MARLNEILVGRFARGLQKVFGIKGEVPVATLAPEIMPVHGLESGIEQRYLEGWDVFAATLNQNAVAASASGVRIRNPLGSNVIAVVEQVTCFSVTGADQPLLQRQRNLNTDLATVPVISINGFDARGRQNPTCILSLAAPAAGLNMNICQKAWSALSQSIDFVVNDTCEYPLLPGDCMQVLSNTVNSALDVTFRWRERFLEESERT